MTADENAVLNIPNLLNLIFSTFLALNWHWAYNKHTHTIADTKMDSLEIVLTPKWKVARAICAIKNAENTEESAPEK